MRLVSLSATVSNAEEFGEWLVSVRGETEVIVHEKRPVPLWQHVLVGTRLFDLFGPDGVSVDGGLLRHVAERGRHFEPMPGRRGGRMPRGWRPPPRPDVIARLDSEGLLPAITFIFSRVGCDAAVRQCVYAGMWLTTEDERTEIDAVVDELTEGIPGEDLDVLGYWEWRDGLRRGLAAHHAGLIPAFKQTVEELFVRGLVRAVFATETLALGINMPARTVVLERLTKYNGESHVDVTPGEYTQLTGRAGRRGIDIEGHAVVVWTPEVDPLRVAGLASTRTYPLRSSFRPSYNMAVNLVDQMGRPDARELLDASFAQFQADRGVAGLLAQIRRNEDTLRQYAKETTCHLGDFMEYAALRRELTEREADLARAGARARKGAVTASLEALRRGDVIRVPRGRRAGLAVVLDPGVHPRDDPRPLVVTEARWSGRLSPIDFPAAVDVLATVRVPKHVNHRSPQERKDLASSLRALDLPAPARKPRDAAGADEDHDVVRLRRALRAHPCHQCADREQHARWAERHAPAGPRERRPARPDRGPHRVARPHVRPDLRAAGRPRLSHRRRDDPGRAAAGPDLVRVRPGRGRVPARRRVERLGPGRTRRRRLGPRVRAAPRRDAGRRDADGRAARRLHHDRPDLGRAQRGRGRARPAAEPRATAGLRLGGVPVGPPGPAGQGADRGREPRHRAVGRRLHPLVQAGARPARPVGDGAGRRRRILVGGQGGARGAVRGAPRCGRPEHAALNVGLGMIDPRRIVRRSAAVFALA